MRAGRTYLQLEVDPTINVRGRLSYLHRLAFVVGNVVFCACTRIISEY